MQRNDSSSAKNVLNYYRQIADDENLCLHEKGVLLIFLRHMDTNYISFPGVERIAMKLKINERTVRKYISKLEKEGKIERSNNHGGGRNCSYRLTLFVSELERQANHLPNSTMKVSSSENDAPDDVQTSDFPRWLKPNNNYAFIDGVGYVPNSTNLERDTSQFAIVPDTPLPTEDEKVDHQIEKLREYARTGTMAQIRLYSRRMKIDQDIIDEILREVEEENAIRG